MAVLFPVFKEISTLFSIVAALVCIPTNSVRGFRVVFRCSKSPADSVYSSHDQFPEGPWQVVLGNTQSFQGFCLRASYNLQGMCGLFTGQMP